MLKRGLTNKSMLFMVIHNNGVLIYSYPLFSEEHILVSSLISAIQALISNIISERNSKLELKFSSYEMICEVEGDFSYCVIVDNERCIHSTPILKGLKEIVENNFPAEIRDNVIRINEEKVKIIDVAIDLFLDALKTHAVNTNIGSSESLYRMWMSTVSVSVDIMKKIYQAILEGKPVFLFHKDLSAAYEFAEIVAQTGLKPIKVEVIRPNDIDNVDLTEQAIYIAKYKPSKVSSIIKNSSVFIDLNPENS